jgi:hypothetical protein
MKWWACQCYDVVKGHAVIGRTAILHDESIVERSTLREITRLLRDLMPLATFA